MVAMFYGRVGSDDEYNNVRSRFGDTTSAEAQLRALRHLGLKADFATNGTPAVLEALVRAGRPVPVGWLHKGHVTSPRGGGHWSVVVGFTPNSWIQNDPNGEALLLSGGYTPNKDGNQVQYSRKNWNQRWMPNGEKGWYVSIKTLDAVAATDSIEVL